MPTTGKSMADSKFGIRVSGLLRRSVLRLRGMPDFSDLPMRAHRGEDQSIQVEPHYAHAATCAIPGRHRAPKGSEMRRAELLRHPAVRKQPLERVRVVRNQRH